MVYGPVAVNVAGTNSGTSEGVVATTPTVAATAAGGNGYAIEGVLTFTGNAAASTVTVKVRQNSISGTTVYTSPAITVAAAAVMAVPFAAVDQSAAATGVANYVVTTTASGAFAASGAVAGMVKVTSVAEND